MTDYMTINNIIDFIKDKSYINSNNQITLYNYTFKGNIDEFNKIGNNYFNIFKDKFNNVIINTCEDYGPITKLYPTLLKETDPDTIIICIDDDKEYDKYLIENLLKGSTKYPEKCICVSGWNYLNLGFIALPFLDIDIYNISFNLNNKNIKNKTSLGNINLINNNWIKCINT